MSLTGSWESRANSLEIQHLENPHLSLRSLLMSGGDLKFAVTLETLRLLESSGAMDATTVGKPPIPTEAVEHGSTQQGTHTAGTDDGGVLPNPRTLVNRSDANIMNLTTQQKDLLFAIVDGCGSSGSEFMFLQSHSSRAGGGGLGFDSQPPIPISAVDLDFRQLRREDLISLEDVPGSGLRGKPTQLGIETATMLRGQAAPSVDPARPTASSRKGIPPRPMSHLPSWKDLQTEFLKYAAEHSDLCAVWTWLYTRADQSAGQPPHGEWSFRGGLPGSQHLFKEIARRTAGLLPDDPSGAEPWKRWLDLMRKEGHGRRLPPRQRSSHQFRTALESGDFVALPPEYENQYEDQQIENILKSSADFCFVRWLAESGPMVTRTGLQNQDPAAPEPATPNPVEVGQEAHPSAPLDGPDFASEAGRNCAVTAYATRWTCSEASLARTATVDPADLVKWKKGELPATSDKKARIENALKKNEPPTPPARPKSGA